MPRYDNTRNDRGNNRNDRSNNSNNRNDRNNRTNTNNRSNRNEQVDVREGELTIIAKGTLRNISDDFQIRSGVSQSGVPFFNGAKIEIQRTINDQVITKKYSVVAFDEAAEDLAEAYDGCWLEFNGDFTKQKGNDDKWYDQFIIREVENIEFPD